MTAERPVHVDATDRHIIELLKENARRPTAEIAARVNLSPAPVARRIERLERTGVITGYTAVLNEELLGGGFEAFAELRFSGDTRVAAIAQAATAIPEVVEAFTIAGDPDSLVRIRVSNVDHLREVVDRLRRATGVIGTKTLMVLGSWKRAG